MCVLKSTIKKDTCIDLTSNSLFSQTEPWKPLPVSYHRLGSWLSSLLTLYSAFFDFLLRVPSLRSSFVLAGERGAETAAGAEWWWSWDSSPPRGDPNSRWHTQDSMRAKGDPWEWRAVMNTCIKRSGARLKCVLMEFLGFWDQKKHFRTMAVKPE